ncbi:spore cortex biosynthesis protein YabQ [Bacillus piscicola]|uniref:spore cortex biosynthesis protein YabQ n=1 Tax=Bacillus piscicola TaxID=1632684 RepID=UPI001F088C65
MSLTVQFQTMFAMLGMGMVLGMNIDFYHRLTVKTVRALWTRAIWDLLFWLVQALLVFYVLLHVNEGELRVYIFLALFIGFFAYRTCGRATFLKGMENGFAVFRWLRRAVSAITRVTIVSPAKIILKLLMSLGMIGLTLVTNILFLLWRIILFPLKLGVRLVTPLCRRILPPSLLRIVRRVMTAVSKWAGRRN